jgi:GAF domain-containing protein
MVARCEVRPFTTQQIALLATFAQLAVIAIENAERFQKSADLIRTLEDHVNRHIDQSERAGGLRR